MSRCYVTRAKHMLNRVILYIATINHYARYKVTNESWKLFVRKARLDGKRKNFIHAKFSFLCLSIRCISIETLFEIFEITFKTFIAQRWRTRPEVSSFEDKSRRGATRDKRLKIILFFARRYLGNRKSYRDK